METIEQIFNGATWEDSHGDIMRLEIKANGKVYGCSNSFDFYRDSKKEALEQLQTWGYRYIGVG